MSRRPRSRIRLWVLRTGIAVICVLVWAGCNLDLLSPFAAFDLLSTPEPRPVANYRFDGDLSDSMSLRVGAVQNGLVARYCADRAAAPGRALELPAPDAQETWPSTMTVSLPVAPESGSCSLGFWFLDTGTSGCPYGWSLRVEAHGKQQTTEQGDYPLSVVVSVKVDTAGAITRTIDVSGPVDSSRTWSTSETFDPPDSSSAAVWHLVAVTRDELGRVRIYFDGGLLDAVQTPTGTTSEIYTLVCTVGNGNPAGAWNSGSSTVTDRLTALDDLLVVSGTLDREQIRELYEGTLSLTGT